MEVGQTLENFQLNISTGCQNVHLTLIQTVKIRDAQHLTEVSLNSKENRRKLNTRDLNRLTIT